MPATFRFMSWNIANYSTKKSTSHFSEFITQAMLSFDVDFLGVLEVMTFVGENLGDEIGGRLLNFDNWVYQDSDQFAAHSEQYLRIWKTDVLKETKQINSFGGLEFPDKNYRPPFIGVYDVGKTAKNMMIGLYHAPGPGQKAKVLAGCANLAKIKDLSEGLLMGDFNVTPSDPSKGPGLKAFGGLIKLGFKQGLAAQATSLKALKSVTRDDATFADCLSSQYDNVFYKLPAGTGTVTCRVMDMLTPAVDDRDADGDTPIGSRFDEKYAERLREYYASTTKGKGWQAKSFKTIKAAFTAYRTTVSDHMPVLLTWNAP